MKTKHNCCGRCGITTSQRNKLRFRGMNRCRANDGKGHPYHEWCY